MKIASLIVLALVGLLVPTLVIGEDPTLKPSNGDDLIAITSKMAAIAPGKPNPPIPRDQIYNFIWTDGFISGAVQAVHMQALADKRDTSCMDVSKASVHTTAIAVNAVINQHPEYRKKSPIAAIYLAVVATYPCILHPAPQ
jgi:hypothetical protein